MNEIMNLHENMNFAHPTSLNYWEFQMRICAVLAA
jgi:hypothetical protein